MKSNLMIFIMAALAIPQASWAVPAFPGAEGFGSTTRGAYALYEQTGDSDDLPVVLKVTNLSDSASTEGSFRWAATRNYPRIIVFVTGGIITISSWMTISNSYLTIAGQTAPGDGIVYRGGMMRFFSPAGGRLQHVIVRGMRSFPTAIYTNNYNGGTAFVVGMDESCTACLPAQDIILDHNSANFSADESMTILAGANRVTFSNNMNYSPTNVANHHYGMMVAPGSTNITFHHNVTAHATFRTPLVGGGMDSNNKPASTNVEIINNVVYNARNWTPANILKNVKYDGHQPQSVAFVGEYHKAGPNTDLSGTGYVFEASASKIYPGSKILYEGILTPRRQNHFLADLAICGPNMCASSLMVDDREDLGFVFSGVTETEASANYAYLMGMTGDVPHVGAYPRDIVDTIAIEEITTGTAFVGTGGAWGPGPTSATTTSNWRNNRSLFPYYAPTSTSRPAWPDTDDDGMCDDWEIMQYGDLTQGPHGDYDNNGWTNIEDWINSFFLTGDPVDSHTLTITDKSTGTGGGTITSVPSGINCGEDCSAGFPEGSSVTLYQEPYEGDTFIQWTGACAGQPSSGCTLSMDADLTASAVFAGPETTFYTLTIDPSVGPGSGTVYAIEVGVTGGTPHRIACGSQGLMCSYAFEVGTRVEVGADLDPGSSWGGWIGDCGTQGQNDCVLQLDSNQSTSARFDVLSGGDEPGNVMVSLPLHGGCAIVLSVEPGSVGLWLVLLAAALGALARLGRAR